MMTDKHPAGTELGTIRSQSPTTWKTGAKRAVRLFTVPTSGLRPVPEFLIIGAQRCGTTSVYKYLAQHPQFRSATMRTKGVHFFDTRYHRGMTWYRAHFPTTVYRNLFRALHHVDLVTGEASPYYLFHPHVPYRIARHMPAARLIVLLRDPIERAYSQWQHELSRGFEDAHTFEEALEREPARLAGEVQRMNADPDYRSFGHQHHSYMARSRYADQIEVYRSLFPPGQLLAIKSEDLFSDPAAEYTRALRFLGLEPHTLARFKQHNGYRRAAMHPDTRARLAEHFADSNARLVEMLGPRFSWEP